MDRPAHSRRRRAFLLAGGGLLLAPLAWSHFAAGDAATAEDPDTDLAIAPEHLECIRRLRFIWVPNVESGGPSVDIEAPFGSPDAYSDLARIAHGRSHPGLKRLYAEVMNRLPVFSRLAKLEPGSYLLPEPAILRLKKFMYRGDPGIGADGRFNFTAEHAKLIAAMKWRYSQPERFAFLFNLSLDPQDWIGPWNVPEVNFKRPFGDMTYFERDMAEILGTRIGAGDHDPEGERLFALYGQMHVAIQVFVMYAAL